MIELLIVISIIAILFTLTLQVVGGLLSQARMSATQTTIQKIQALLNERSQAFNRLVLRKGYLESTPEWQRVQIYLGPSNLNINDATLQRILTTKLLEARYFPQRINEINPQYQPVLCAKYGAQFSLTNNDPTLYNYLSDPNAQLRSSEILYDFLTQSNVLGTTPLGTDTFSAQEVVDTDGNGLPEFIDAWGKPLRFYRWPTRLFRSQGQNSNGVLNPITTPTNPNPSPPYPAGFNDLTNVQTLFSSIPSFSSTLLQYDLQRDPDDPMQDCLVTFASLNMAFENRPVPSPTGSPVLMPTPATYFVWLVTSPGPDGIPGMWEPCDVNNLGHLGAINPAALADLTDDIIPLNIRAGGK